MGRKRANHSLLGRNLMDYFKYENVNLLYQLMSDCLPPIPKRGVTDELAAKILGYNRPDYIALISMRDRKDVTFSTVEAFAQRLRVPLPILFDRSCQTIIYGYYQEALRDGSLPQTFKAEAYLKNFATNIKRTIKENRWEIQRLYSKSPHELSPWDGDAVGHSAIHNVLKASEDKPCNPKISTLGWMALSCGYEWADLGFLLANPQSLAVDRKNGHRLLTPVNNQNELILIQAP